MSASKLSVWLSASFTECGNRAQDIEMILKQAEGKDPAELAELRALAAAHHAAADVYRDALLKSLK